LVLAADLVSKVPAGVVSPDLPTTAGVRRPLDSPSQLEKGSVLGSLYLQMILKFMKCESLTFDPWLSTNDNFLLPESIGLKLWREAGRRRAEGCDGVCGNLRPPTETKGNASVFSWAQLNWNFSRIPATHLIFSRAALGSFHSSDKAEHTVDLGNVPSYSRLALAFCQPETKFC